MSAPLEIAFEAHMQAAVARLGTLRYCDADRKRVADVVKQVTLEVFGEEIGWPMVREEWQRLAAADFIINAILSPEDAENRKVVIEFTGPSWLT